MKIHAVCPVCRVLLTWDDPQAELWGQIDPTDLGCVSVTRGYAPEVEGHLNAHRTDGTFNRSLGEHHERTKAIAEGFLARFPVNG